MNERIITRWWLVCLTLGVLALWRISYAEYTHRNPYTHNVWGFITQTNLVLRERY